VAFALGLHALALAPGAASRDAPSSRKCVSERFHDHENIMGTSVTAGNSGREIARRKERAQPATVTPFGGVRPSTGGLGGMGWPDGETIPIRLITSK